MNPFSPLYIISFLGFEFKYISVMSWDLKRSFGGYFSYLDVYSSIILINILDYRIHLWEKTIFRYSDFSGTFCYHGIIYD
jgi:hypothetical protein